MSMIEAKHIPAAPTRRPKYEAYGIRLDQVEDTTHVFKDEVLVGSFTIDTTTWTLKFNFPGNRYFNYFAYIASDKGINRLQWVNENLKQNTMDQIQAGVAFLGFAKFEEEMARHDRLSKHGSAAAH